MRRSAFATAGIVLLVVSGCATTTRRAALCECSPAAAAWASSIRTAGAFAEAGRFDAADSTFVAFSTAHPGTHQAREITFWRALYQMDPRNPAPKPEAAAQLLDAYLLSDSVYWYRSEARLLRQLAALQSPNVAALPPTRTTASRATVPVTRAGDATITDKDVEIQQLRERVARLNEELERIKRRLSTP